MSHNNGYKKQRFEDPWTDAMADNDVEPTQEIIDEVNARIAKIREEQVIPRHLKRGERSKYVEEPGIQVITPVFNSGGLNRLKN